MTYEVVVVGGGIGGLTVAALLAARGVNVCLLERESRPGGCVAGFEKFGYEFDPGVGIYPLWQAGEIHDLVFSELPVKPPQVFFRDPAYLVRLPDQSEVAISANTEAFEETLRATFPECADKAIRFYRESARTSDALRSAIRKAPDFATLGSLKQLYTLLPRVANASRVMKGRNQTASSQLEGVSHRFRRFVDVQLQLLTQAASDECGYLYSSLALSLARQSTFSIHGGAPALAERLAESIKISGGKIRFDTPVLRLAYDTSGRAEGVDLLSGETVRATRAIISNLTVWDTYGKLIGLTRTTVDVRKTLNNLRAWGVYLLYLGIEEAVATRLPNSHILALTDWQDDQPYDAETAQLMFASASGSDPRAPEGKRAVTVQTFCDVDQWFTFHENEDEHEQKDRSVIEALWPRLLRAIPELGDAAESAELIETMTPRTLYDMTRRKLGMVGGFPNPFSPSAFSSATSLPNVFMISDTTFPGGGIAGVTFAALSLTNRLAPRS